MAPVRPTLPVRPGSPVRPGPPGLPSDPLAPVVPRYHKQQKTPNRNLNGEVNCILSGRYGSIEYMCPKSGVNANFGHLIVRVI